MKEGIDMGIYKKINHNKLGEIYCKTDEDEQPICWAKKENVNFFSDKYGEIEIRLNLYYFNKEYKCKKDIKGKENEDNIIKWVGILLGDKDKIEEALWEYYNYDMEDEYDEYYGYDNMERPNLENKQELYNHIKVEYAIIYTTGYVVVVSVSWGWMNLAIRVKCASEDENDSAYVIAAQEILPAELDYFN